MAVRQVLERCWRGLGARAPSEVIAAGSFRRRMASGSAGVSDGTLASPHLSFQAARAALLRRHTCRGFVDHAASTLRHRAALDPTRFLAARRPPCRLLRGEANLVAGDISCYAACGALLPRPACTVLNSAARGRLLPRCAGHQRERLRMGAAGVAPAGLAAPRTAYEQFPPDIGFAPTPGSTRSKIFCGLIIASLASQAWNEAKAWYVYFSGKASDNADSLWADRIKRIKVADDVEIQDFIFIFWVET